MAVTIEAPSTCAEVGCIGDRVDTHGGAYRSEVEDVLFPTGLFGLELRRVYRSDNPRVGWFGRGWSTVYETTVAVVEGSVVIDAPAGIEPLWEPDAPAGWLMAGGSSVRRVGDGFELAWPGGETWSFAASGSLRALRSPFGAEVTIEQADEAITLRSSQGVEMTLRLEDAKVVAAETTDGRRAEYTYARDALTAADAPGQELTYGYDGEGLLTDVTSPAGSSSATYSDAKVNRHRSMSGQQFVLDYTEGTTNVRSAGSTSAYEHDEQGRLVGIALGDHQVLTQSFDDDGRLTTRTERAFPGGEVLGSLERTFDEGRLAAETVDGLTTRFRYDARGRVTEISGATSASFEYSGEDLLPSSATTPEAGRSELVYVDGFLASRTDATGVTSVTTRDLLGNPVAVGATPDERWTYEFDAEGNVTATVAPGGRRWVSEWGPRATLRRERDPLGRTTSFTYDGGGRVIREDAPGGVAERAYDDDGLLVALTEPDGLTTRYEHDAFGRVQAIVTPGDRTWRLTYEDRPDGARTVTTTAPDATTTVTRFDTGGRELGRQFFDADRALVEEVTNTYEFDRRTQTITRRGRSSLVERTSYDDAGRVVDVETVLDGESIRADSYEYERGRIATARSAGTEAAYRYDDAGRLVEVESESDRWAATYDDGEIATTRHNDEVTAIERDADGRPIRFVDEQGIATEWSYDAADRPVSRSVGEAAASFEWDLADRLTTYRAPSGATWEWAYDSVGRLTSANEPGGRATTYEYEVGRVQRVRTRGSGGDRDDTYRYDARGLLREAETDAGKFQYEYDAAGRIVEIDGPRDDDHEHWILDASGRTVEVTSGRRTYTLDYTASGQLERIEDREGDEFLEVVWDGSSLQDVMVDGHDALGISVDDEGRPTSITWDDDTAVDLEWRGAESFVARLRGTDETVEYTVDEGILTSFAHDGTTYRATARNGTIQSVGVTSSTFAGTLEYDAYGRPAVLRSADRATTITYDRERRVSSVLTTRSGTSDEVTTVTYADGRDVDGDDDLVDALFDEAGALKQSLPSALPNPLSAGADAASLQQTSMIDGVDELLVAEPTPFAQVESAVSASAPSLTGPMGVRDRLRLARQLLVAEVSRLAPIVSLGDATAIRIPIIDPADGELADFNPFVDASPTGLALGVLARQAGGGGSVFEQAADRLGDIVGGAVSFAGDVARFIATNPVARFVLAGVTVAVPVACAIVGPGCVGPGVVLIRVAAVLGTADSFRDAVASCRSGDAASCGLNIAFVAMAVAEVVFAPAIAGASSGARGARLPIVNGRQPINAAHAGRVFDGPGWTNELGRTYSSGVRFSRAGYPDFSPYALGKVRIRNLTGDYATDAMRANRQLGMAVTPGGLVWHHVEDCRTLLLITRELHDAVRHSGGASRIRAGAC